MKEANIRLLIMLILATLNVASINAMQKIQKKRPPIDKIWLDGFYIITDFEKTEKEKKDFLETFLIDHPDVVTRKFNNNTLFHIAIARGYLSIVTLLLKNGANESETNSEGKTPLEIAQEIKKRNKRLESLLVSAKNSAGKLVKLISSVDKTTQEILSESKKLISKFPGLVDRKSSNHGKTSLHLAVLTGDFGLVKFLIANRASPLIKDFKNNTPRDIACKKNFKKIEKYLETIEEARFDYMSNRKEAWAKLKGNH